MRRGHILLGWLIAAAATQLAQGAPQLSTLELQGGESAATVNLTLSGPVQPHLFTLDHPDRLVIDLPHTHRAAGLSLPAASGVIKAVRIGPQLDGTLRIVVDLSSALPYHGAQRPAAHGYQLQIRLGGGASAAAEAPPPRAVLPVTPEHAPAGQDRDVIVAVDAGHGGEDPGATGPHGTREKDVTLAIARQLAQKLDQLPGVHAVLTRSGDYFLPLRERMVRARAAHADLFVSIHADAVRDPAVSGASVYVVSDRGASNEAAHWLAERENSADLKGGVSLGDKSGDLASVLLDLSQTASQGASVEAATEVLGSLDGVGAVRRRDVQYAAFVVLKSPDVPSMLVETAYISNPQEERTLRAPAGQDRLAGAVCAGIQRYFTAHPPEGSRFVHPRRGSDEPAAVAMAHGTP